MKISKKKSVTTTKVEDLEEENVEKVDVKSPRRSKRKKSEVEKERKSVKEEKMTSMKSVNQGNIPIVSKNNKNNNLNDDDGDDDKVIEGEKEGGNDKVNTKSSPNKKVKSASPKKTKKAKIAHQRITERDDIPKLWDAQEALDKHGSYTFKILSWNVAGLRAVLRNHPDALPNLAIKYDVDVICLQETKLQESHVTDPKLKIKGYLLETEGYESYYSCSTAKKGYSGTAVFVKKRHVTTGTESKKKQSTLNSFLAVGDDDVTSKDDKASNTQKKKLGSINASDLIPINTSYALGKKEHDMEGRVISVDFPLFTLVNLYVPNSGAKLERLTYRTESWDTDLVDYMLQKEKDRELPVIWCGDLNVAHKAMDVWNDGAPHLKKSAGTTPEERESFQRQLDTNDSSFLDAFRKLHPDAKGHYSYWSQRAGNREPNKGLRLDYFIGSKQLFDYDSEETKVLIRDSYMLPEQVGSDHCPVVLELEIKK